MSEEQKPKQKDILESFSREFPLLEQAYTGYSLVQGLSASEDNTLRKSAEITVLEVLELIVVANRQRKEDKRQTLLAALAKLDTVKVFVDMARSIKAITDDQYSPMIEQCKSLGKMLGGWAKAVKSA